MPTRVVFLDTSFVLALENKGDPHHTCAKLLDSELLNERASLLLHWGILLEIADGYARRARRHKAFELLRRIEHESGYLVRPITASLLADSLALYRARPDKEWNLTDCISFQLMKQENVTDALTADLHFRQAGFRALLLE